MSGPLSESGLAPALAKFAEHDIAAASILENLYYRVMFSSEQAQLRAEGFEQSRLSENRATAQANDAIQGEIRTLKESREEARNVAECELDIIDAERPAREAAANKAVSALGVPYDATSSSQACIEQIVDRPAETVAADLGEPHAPYMRAWTLKSWVCHGLTVSMGLFVGVNYMSILNALPVDRIFSRPPLGPLIAAVIVGCCISVMSSYAIRILFGIASEQWHRTRSLRSAVPYFALAGGMLLLFCWIDTQVEQQGLLKMATSHQKLASLAHPRGSGPAQATPSYVWASLIVMVGYLIYQACLGYIEGLRAAENRVKSHLLKETEAARHALRSDPAFCAATEALGSVRTLNERHAEVCRRRDETFAAIDTQIARLEAQIEPLREGFTEEEKLLLQQALDDLGGDQRDFDQSFELTSDAWREAAGLKRLGPIINVHRRGLISHYFWRWNLGRRSVRVR